jgi:serine/threonine protein kinase
MGGKKRNPLSSDHTLFLLLLLFIFFPRMEGALPSMPSLVLDDYERIREIQKSLFGRVILAKHKTSEALVVIKQSMLVELQRKRVHEDVHREARLLHFLQQQPIDKETVAPTWHTQVSPVAWRYLEHACFLQRMVGTHETPKMHHLVTTFASHGDLFHIVDRQALSEARVRMWFRHVCCGVRFLHMMGVAHGDVSLENIVISSDDIARITDFGLAHQHPIAAAAVAHGDLSSTTVRWIDMSGGASPPQLPPPPLLTCTCNRCVAPSPFRTQGVPGALRFLCQPVCRRMNAPGKCTYVSPELSQGLHWDAFSNDVFALGVLLYTMLCRVPPFSQTNQPNDPWFHNIYSGAWLRSPMIEQKSSRVYHHLSLSAATLIDAMISPQATRPTLDQVLASDFFGSSRL